MSRILITGSADGLGLMAGQHLIGEGHDVVLHARNDDRARDTRAAAPGAADVLVGDLASIDETRKVAEQAIAAGPFDAVIHNAAVGYQERRRIGTVDGLAHVFAINVLAPYLLTALIPAPSRLVYLSSGMHRGGDPDLDDLQWERKRWNGSQAYADSKLFDAVLAVAVARRRPSVRSNAVDPGWVPTRMGGRGAPDDLAQGSATQTWLATSDDRAATTTGGYFYHRRPRQAHPATDDPRVQDGLLAACAGLTGIELG
ncbi:MAG: SDR family NAD(P)-dependent oxidoreductase [Actinophytocola sp.]|uniref:SDR family NAD(P)-dependent oxidoreductase n=1 Tax=Actinophytocola sp. TaxID=1872138 RepID=UPI00132090CA|nr:SDR family NAD(P)-dependent oxidoreductase [Actinophytocola sp.]MPZ83503.1 SDR family NAD(P)-dependent oxidoreductase [Actinophytocola sp.]